MSTSPALRHSFRILYVDESAHFRAQVRTLLQSHQAECLLLEAGSRQEAEQFFDGHELNLILVDERALAPHPVGLTELLHRQSSKIPILVLGFREPISSGLPTSSSPRTEFFPKTPEGLARLRYRIRDEIERAAQSDRLRVHKDRRDFNISAPPGTNVFSPSMDFQERAPETAPSTKPDDDFLDSAGLYQALLENAPLGIIIVDAEEPRTGRVVLANSAAAELYGFDPREMQSINVADLSATAVREATWGRVRNAAATSPIVSELVARRKDGSQITVEIRSKAFPWNGRRWIMEFHRDVTLRRQSERSLRESQDRLQRLFDSDLVGLVFWNWDLPHHFVDANETYCNMLGCTRDELLNGRVLWRDRTPPEYWARDDQAIRELKETGRCQPYEKEYVRPDGKRIPVLLNIAALHVGSRQGVACCLDITDLWLARKELELDREHRAHAARLDTLGEMAGSLAHELNQPLCAIMTNAAACRNTLMKLQGDHREVLETLGSVIAQAERAGEIIRRIRTFIRKREPAKIAADINEIVRDNVEFIKTECLQNNSVLDLRLADIPPVCADPVLIGQVLINLLRNGIESMKDTPPASRQLVISTRVLEEGFVEVAVTDHGCGISEDATKHIFKPFFTSKSGDLGLGLALSRSIIESHEGLIWFTKNETIGTTFRFALPVAPTMRGP